MQQFLLSDVNEMHAVLKSIGTARLLTPILTANRAAFFLIFLPIFSERQNCNQTRCKKLLSSNSKCINFPVAPLHKPSDKSMFVVLR